MSKYYTTIWELPVYSWFKVLTKKNLGFLQIGSLNVPPDNVTEDESKEAVELWHSLNDQFMAEFGQDETTVDLLEKKRDLGILYAEYLQTGNKFKLTQIEIKQIDLERYTNDEEFNPTKEVGVLSKYIGSAIDTKKTSVHQYYTLKETFK